MSVAIAVADILDVVSEHYDCSKVDLRSHRRTADVVKPRQIAMYLAKRLTERSLPQIGAAIGGRAHTTVLHGIARVEQMLAETPALSEEIAALEIAVVTLGKLRARGLLPQPGEEMSPVEMARKITLGGQRAALRATPDQVLELCDALLAAEEARETERQMAERAIAPMPIFVPVEEAPPPPGPPLVDLVHDFIGVEAMCRTAPSTNLRRARKDLVDALRARRAESREIDALVSAFDAVANAEGAGVNDQRAAADAYRRACRAAADTFLRQKEAAHG